MTNANESLTLRQAKKRRIRVRKEDSAFIYFLLESYEGMTAYSTLPHQVGDTHRDLELSYTVDFESEVDKFLTEMGEMVHGLEE